MSRLGIVLPVVLQQPVLLELTRTAVSRIRTSADARLYVLANHLRLGTPEELRADLQRRCGLPVQVTAGARGVSASWNEGLRQALRDGADYLLVLANDVLLEESTIDRLLAFGGQSGPEVAVWCGVPADVPAAAEPGWVSDGHDFACCMLRPDTLSRHGWFDENFWPAYFEDNDYYARVVLGGGQCVMVHAARFVHLHSQTIGHDPEVAMHVRNWWAWNVDYFRRKWGVPHPGSNREEVRATYFPHPWNDPQRPLSWWPPE